MSKCKYFVTLKCNWVENTQLVYFYFVEYDDQLCCNFTKEVVGFSWGRHIINISPFLYSILCNKSLHYLLSRMGRRRKRIALCYLMSSSFQKGTLKKKKKRALILILVQKKSSKQTEFVILTSQCL